MFVQLSLASLLFIDNPVGTGYSYVESDDAYTTDVQMIAADLLTVFSAFLNQNKDFQVRWHSLAAAALSFRQHCWPCMWALSLRRGKKTQILLSLHIFILINHWNHTFKQILPLSTKRFWSKVYADKQESPQMLNRWQMINFYRYCTVWDFQFIFPPITKKVWNKLHHTVLVDSQQSYLQSNKDCKIYAGYIFWT